MISGARGGSEAGEKIDLTVVMEKKTTLGKGVFRKRLSLSNVEWQ
jgi:hypothetical protein